MALTPDEHARLHDAIAVHMDEILKLFKRGARITVVIRNPRYGDAGVVIGNDEPAEIVAELKRRYPELNDARTG